MPWKRRHHELYYYRQRWVDGRALTEYVGARGAGVRAATLDAMRREEREAEAAAWRAEAAGLRAEDEAAAGLSASVDAILALALRASGHHLRKREWRKRRHAMGDLATTRGAAAPAPRPYTGAPPKGPWHGVGREEVVDILGRASAGDAEAMARAGELFDEHPEGMLHVCGGEVRDRTEGLLIGFLAGEANPLVREALGRKLDRLRAELAGPYPTPLERLLAERAATTWLDMQWQDLRYARSEKEGMTFKKADCLDRLRGRAGARHLAALKALALVRKLGVTAVQVVVEKVEVGIPAPAAAIGAPDPPGA